MIPRRIKIHGFNNLRDIDIDLTGLPPGLIAICGNNGEGKTTLMEAIGIVPFVLTFPSRPGPLKDRAATRDANIEADFDHDGHAYRAVIQCDPDANGRRGKTEAILYRDGQPQGSGLLKEYAEAVERFLPSPAVVKASTFSAQDGTGSFRDLSIAERRDLFTELLGNSRLQQLSERAMAHRKELGTELEKLGGQLDDVRAKIAEAQRANEAIEIAKANAEAAGRAIDPLEKALAERIAERDEVAAEVAKHDNLRDERLSQVRVLYDERAVFDRSTRENAADLDAARSTLAHAEQLEAEGKRRAHLVSERDRLAADYRLAVREVEIAEKDLAAARGQYNGVRDRLAGLTRDKPADGAVERVERLEGDLRFKMDQATVPAVASSELDEAQESHTAANRAYNDARAAAGDHQTPDVVRTRIQQAADASNTLGGVPCSGEGPFDGCRFLIDAVSSAALLPQLREELTGAETAWAKVAEAELFVVKARSVLEQCRVTMEQARSQSDEIERIGREIGALHTAIDATERNADELASLETERDRMAGELRELGGVADRCRHTVDQIKRDGAEVRGQLDAMPETDGRQQVADARAAVPNLERRADEIERGRQRIEAAIAKVDVPEEATTKRQELETAEHYRIEAETALVDARAEADAMRQHLAKRQGFRAALGDPDAEHTELAARRESTAATAAGYHLVERALGRNGIQALEIDAAGPRVSEISTDLIQVMWGPRFAVRLQTIQPAEGARKQREVFDIVAIDAVHGKPLKIDELSGGEQVPVDEALKLALALFNAERHGNTLPVMFRDECDGALSPQYAAAYPAMLRHAMAIGGFEQVYFVSHRPEVRDQADARIVLEGGQARIEG